MGKRCFFCHLLIDSNCIWGAFCSASCESNWTTHIISKLDSHECLEIMAIAVAKCAGAAATNEAAGVKLREPGIRMKAKGA